jgi:hypothetical protein
MRYGEKLAKEKSEKNEFSRTSMGRELSSDVVSRQVDGPFFMDFEESLADDPANYFLQADERFPD